MNAQGKSISTNAVLKLNSTKRIYPTEELQTRFDSTSNIVRKNCRRKCMELPLLPPKLEARVIGPSCLSDGNTPASSFNGSNAR